MTPKPIIVWFRNDLRLSDHPALSAAAQTGVPVIALYILDDGAAGEWRRGGASRWWLHHSLAALGGSLSAASVRLVLRRGDTVNIIAGLARESGAQAVYCTRAHEPWAVALEQSLRGRLEADGVTLRRFAGALLHDPDKLLTKSGGPYKVYTPFWRSLSQQAIRRPLPAPDRLRDFDGSVAGDQLDDWELLPGKPDWASGFREAWVPGETRARARLGEFIQEAVEAYADRRDLPGTTGTSRLSPHLHFGEISPAQVWHEVSGASDRGELSGAGPEVYLKEIAWREFSYHLLHHFPQLPDKPFRDAFATFGWQGTPADLGAWQRGRSGYPIVDAGMRELWATGWMHNRVRMVAASFLTKHLMVPWQDGEAWFWDCLVDADLASNAASWQWVAGSGADAAPYFRIFNPIAQGEKFDSDGAYVRRWVPELSGLPDKFLHAPWLAPEAVLEAADVRLGDNYPLPIVDHKQARERALAAYAAMKD